MADLQRKTANLWDNLGFSADLISTSGIHSLSNDYGTSLSTVSGGSVDITQVASGGTTFYQNGFFYIEIDFSQFSLGDNIVISFDYEITNKLSSTSTTLAFVGQGGLSTNVIGNWGESGRAIIQATITSDMTNPYVEIRLCGNSIKVRNVQVNLGSTAKPYEPYGWVHSLRKLTTATEAVENPLYSDGTAITAYTIKGNTVQSGTPSPQNPVTIQGVGNETANLLNYKEITTTPNYATVTLITNGVNLTGKYMATIDISLEVGSTYKMSWLQEVVSGTADTGWRYKYTDNTYSNYGGNGGGITVEKDVSQVLLYVTKSNDTASVNYTNIMLSKGSTSLPYEPYGFKISISSNGTALTPIYFSQQLYKINDTVDTEVSSGTATYAIKKYEITGQEYWADVGVPRGDTYLYMFSPTGIIDVGNVAALDVICTHFVCGSYYSGNTDGLQHSQASLYFRTTETTLGNWKTWLANQYAAGTPVTVYYILATPTTETVTAPTIPTTEGANTITVDTTVQPSEFTATWTGWHDSSVKEYTEGVNLSPITAFTNTKTDTRQFIRPRIQTKLNSVEQQFITFADISATGTISHTVNITKDNDTLSFIHSGAQANITIFSISGGVPQGTYTLSFDVQGYDCSTVGGVVLSNIELKDSNGGHWE